MSGDLDRLHEALGGLLDVESGLRDATRTAARAALDAALRRQLDADSGLNAILLEPPARGLRAFAEALARKPPHARLPVRRAGWPDTVRSTRRIGRLLLTAIDIDQDIRRTLRTRTALRHRRGLDRAIRRTGALARALARPVAGLFAGVTEQVTDLHSALRLIRLVGRAPDEAEGSVVKGKARSLARNLLLALIIEVDSSEQPALFTAALDDIKEIDRLLFNRSFGTARQRIQEAVRAMARIDELVSDFVGADLTDARLKGIPLDGIRWSDSTQWPDDWVEQIRRRSVEVAPGLFVIGGRGRRIRVDQVP